MTAPELDTPYVVTTVTLTDVLAANDDAYLCRLLSHGVPVTQRPLRPQTPTCPCGSEWEALWERGDLYAEVADTPLDSLHIVHPDGRVIGTEHGDAITPYPLLRLNVVWHGPLPT